MIPNSSGCSLLSSSPHSSMGLTELITDNVWSRWGQGQDINKLFHRQSTGLKPAHVTTLQRLAARWQTHEENATMTKRWRSFEGDRPAMESVTGTCYILTACKVPTIILSPIKKKSIFGKPTHKEGNLIDNIRKGMGQILMPGLSSLIHSPHGQGVNSDRVLIQLTLDAPRRQSRH